MDAWHILGIPQTTDRKVVKKAYSRLLKTTRPDDDAEAYQRLREAFDWASGYCRHMANQAPVQDEAQTLSSQEVTRPLELREDENPQAPTEDLRSNVSREDPEVCLGDEVNNEYCRDDVQDRSINSDQKANDDALVAVQSIFDFEDEDQSIDAFNTLFHGHDLLHLKTRAYFEGICLYALMERSAGNLPYGLLNTIAKAFQWFELQHPEPEKARQVSYLNTRLNVFVAYQNELVNGAHSGADKSAAKLLIGKYRPKYFHFLRFIGSNNVKLRKITDYFETVVKQDLCPELKTETFFWWEKQLSRCLFSFWHILVGLLVGTIGFVVFDGIVSAVPLKFYGLVLAASIIISSLSVWAIQFGISKLKPPLLIWWEGIKDKRSTDLILSGIVVFSITLWRHNSDVENIGYLWLPAIIATLLLFGLQGSGMVLMHIAVYAISLAMIDPLEKYSGLASLCGLYGFVIQKLFTLCLGKLPNKIQHILLRHYAYHWWLSGVFGALISTVSLLFLAR